MRFIILTLTLVLLSGCALSPGLHISDSSTGWGLGAHDQVKTVPITGELIARQLQKPGARETVGNHINNSMASYEYRVSPHDVLQITVWNHPELTNPAGELGIGTSASNASPSGRLVRSDGTIFYPYVGVVAVAGKTVEEIRQILTVRLKGYIESPQVDVRVIDFRGQLVYVTGEVAKPGIYSIGDQGMTVLDAINLSGATSHQTLSIQNNTSLAFTADLAHVTVSRNDTVFTINVWDILRRGKVSQNIRLQGGDVVHVPSNLRNKVFVLGEVGKQRAVVISEGHMSLAEAITEAGGFDQETSNPARVFVIRGKIFREKADEQTSGQSSQPAIYSLNAESADAMLLADQFQLQPRDIVYVSTAAVVRWGRVLNQLTGTIQAINLGIAATRRK